MQHPAIARPSDAILPIGADGSATTMSQQAFGLQRTRFAPPVALLNFRTKGTYMRHLIALTSALGLSLCIVPAGFAQTGTQAKCDKNQIVCVQKIEPPQVQAHGGKLPGEKVQNGNAGIKPTKPKTATQIAQKPHTPRIGQSAQQSQRFEPAATSRFKAPPKGQEYRVIDGTLVVVKSNSLEILAVIGGLNALLQ
jgi:hypothetical protein